VPAAAVIPAPIAYIKVVAVKKLVVGFLVGGQERHEVSACVPRHPSVKPVRCLFADRRLRYFTLRKLECFRQARPGYISME
jgi:hypothetical protein